VFRRTIQECSEAIAAEAGWNLEAAIREGAEWDQIDSWCRPALMAMSLGLTAQWRAWGIEPALVVRPQHGPRWPPRMSQAH